MSEIYGASAATSKASETSFADEVESDLSLLTLLKEEAKKDIQRVVTYPIEERPGWTAEFDTNIDLKDFNRYTKSAQGKRKRADADAAVFSGMALVEHNTKILFQGKAVTTGDGDDLTFSSEEFLAMFGTHSAVEALRKFMGDGHLIATAGALYKEAGYAGEATPEDPSDA